MSQPESLDVKEISMDQLPSNVCSYKDSRGMSKFNSEINMIKNMMKGLLKHCAYE